MCESIINALPYPYLRLRHDEKSSARVAVLGAGGARVRLSGSRLRRRASRVRALVCASTVVSRL